MVMKKSIVCFILLMGLFACKSDEKKAASHLEKARQYMNQGIFNSAKLEIDTIRTFYPKAYAVVKESIKLMYEIELKEQTRTNKYCDSILVSLIPKAEILKKEFILDKDPKYQETGNWILKSQSVEANIGQSYIRTGVSENGEMYITSVYYGKAPIHHKAIKISTPDGLFAETQPIEADGGNNDSFVDGGMTSEIVTYLHKKENGITGFIKLYGVNQLKVTYLGDKEFSFILDEKTKQAVYKTYELAQALSAINKYSNELNLSAKKIRLLNLKIDQKK
jgi:hypothetical protein